MNDALCFLTMTMFIQVFSWCKFCLPESIFEWQTYCSLGSQEGLALTVHLSWETVCLSVSGWWGCFSETSLLVWRAKWYCTQLALSTPYFSFFVMATLAPCMIRLPSTGKETAGAVESGPAVAIRRFGIYFCPANNLLYALWKAICFIFLHVFSHL